MSNDYSTEAAAVADAIAAVYENKQVNKKNDISGDFSTDNVSYPTAKAVKIELDKKISTSNTAGLVRNDGSIDTSTYLTSHQSLSDAGGIVTVEEQLVADTGYAKTYVIKQGSSSSKSQVGVKINIPKDFLVRSGSVKTCIQDNVPVQGYKAGDLYIDFVINAKDSSATDEHIYILVSDLLSGDTYNADETTITLNANNNTFSIKSLGVDTGQIKAKAVTKAKLADEVSSQWISDAQGEIQTFATALAAAINPQS